MPQKINNKKINKKNMEINLKSILALKKIRAGFFGAIILVLIVFCFYTYGNFNIEQKPWSVVYLTSGEIYIGKISYLPKMQISDAYLLQIVKTQPKENEEVKSSFQLTPINEALWSPEYLNLSRKQIVFYGPIQQDSQIAEAIRNAKD